MNEISQSVLWSNSTLQSLSCNLASIGQRQTPDATSDKLRLFCARIKCHDVRIKFFFSFRERPYKFWTRGEEQRKRSIIYICEIRMNLLERK